MTDKEMIQAARALKKECERRSNCEGCPLVDGNYCSLDEEVPKFWNVPEVNDND